MATVLWLWAKIRPDKLRIDWHLPLVLRGTRLVATLPERVAQMFASTLAVKTFPLPFEPPALHEILLWHKRNESDPAHAWLRDLVIRLTQEL